MANAVFTKAVNAALAARHQLPDAKTVDLSRVSGAEFAKYMAEATKLGVQHATDEQPVLNRREVVALFCRDYRNFHAIALHAAYKAGRSHVEAMGLQ